MPLSLRADSAADRKIEELASSSYNFRAVLEKQVTVKADNGVVTLTGAVLDQDQKELAETTVRDIPGITKVISELKVASPPPEAADGWIALKIRSVLLLRANVNADATEVSVRDGHVSLTGTAESPTQKKLTEDYVREVAGVKSVKNQLVIKDGPASETETANLKPPERIDDASITAQIKHALASGQFATRSETEVATHNGVVVLSGSARSVLERESMTELVRMIRGVNSVNNAMTVPAAE
ncbi:MAG: BON domain-containing protein [Opitutus sp.]